MLLLDTSVLIDLERELASREVGRVRTWLGRHRSEALACSVISVAELAAGAEVIRVQLLLRRLRKVPVTEAVAYRAGALDRALRAAGRRLGENDTLIAGTALELSATLVYSDGDFDRVPDLRRRRL